MSEKLRKHLGVLGDKAEKEAAPGQKYFAIGDPLDVEPHGELVPLLSFVDDNLSRFVVSNAPSTRWGKIDGDAALELVIVALPNRAIAPRDGVFLVTGPGRDTTEPNPSGEGKLHVVHLGVPRRLWSAGAIQRLYVYRLDGVQSKGLVSGRR